MALQNSSYMREILVGLEIIVHEENILNCSFCHLPNLERFCIIVDIPNLNQTFLGFDLNIFFGLPQSLETMNKLKSLRTSRLQFNYSKPFNFSLDDLSLRGGSNESDTLCNLFQNSAKSLKNLEIMTCGKSDGLKTLNDKIEFIRMFERIALTTDSTRDWMRIVMNLSNVSLLRVFTDFSRFDRINRKAKWLRYLVIEKYWDGWIYRPIDVEALKFALRENLINLKGLMIHELVEGSEVDVICNERGLELHEKTEQVKDSSHVWEKWLSLELGVHKFSWLEKF
jgi:hypothetical protein